MFDVNKDGQISIKELENVAKALQMNVNHVRIWILFNEFLCPFSCALLALPLQTNELLTALLETTGSND